MLRERDDIDYFYNVYKDDPSEENLRNIVRYRPQDRYDAIAKKVIMRELREKVKEVGKK